MIFYGETGDMLEYHHLIKRPKHKHIWDASFVNEIGKLAQVMPGRVEGTNKMFLISKQELPQDRFKDITHRQII